MAKVVGLVGSTSGKIGNIVYAVTNGIQVARVYQPVISNPKSGAQMLQRAKGNLAGRLSMITPREAIVGLGSNARRRRAEYLRNILLGATSVLSDGQYVAKLTPEKLIFSKGATIPVIVTTNVAASASGIVTITYQRPSYATQDDWNVAGGMFVAVTIDDVTGNYDFVQTAQWTKPAYPTAESPLTQTLFVENIDEHDIFVYFVPYKLNNQLGSTVSSGIAVDVSDYVANLGITEVASNLSFGNSKFVGMAEVQ